MAVSLSIGQGFLVATKALKEAFCRGNLDRTIAPAITCLPRSIRQGEVVRPLKVDILSADDDVRKLT